MADYLKDKLKILCREMYESAYLLSFFPQYDMEK